MFQARIEHAADIITAQQVARRAAGAFGFSQRCCAEIVVIASELASNILKHAGKGVVRVETITDPDQGDGIRVMAEDDGPPFRDFETALLDGFDQDGPLDVNALASRRGTGSGLGAVRRFSHELSWEQRDSGKVVIATRYIKKGRIAGIAKRR